MMEKELESIFESIANKRGWKVLMKSRGQGPGILIEKDNKIVVIEFKTKIDAISRAWNRTTFVLEIFSTKYSGIFY
jgi:hypothetical protein